MGFGFRFGGFSVPFPLRPCNVSNLSRLKYQMASHGELGRLMTSSSSFISCPPTTQKAGVCPWRAVRAVF